MNKAEVKKIEEFLSKVPTHKRDAYISLIKAFYLHQEEEKLNKEFLEKIIPLLTPPKKGMESSEVYEWDIMKTKKQ